MKSILSKLKLSVSSASSIANNAIEKVSNEFGTTLDDKATQKLKQQTINVFRVAASVARNLGDLNNDGKVDRDDIKYALEKAGFVWDKIDSDLKEALLIGGVAAFGVNAVPIIGTFAAVPTFAGATAIFFVRAKIAAVSVKKIIKEDKETESKSPD